MTDYRALCAELLVALKSWSPHGGGPLECWEDREEEASLIARAEALLAKPAPERPTAKELRPIFDDQSGYIGDEQVMWSGDFVAAARAVLARWGNA
jgi:hypothetical protein